MTTPAAKMPERQPDDRLDRVEHDVADLKTATMRLTTVAETIDDRQRKFGEELGSIKVVVLKHGELLAGQGKQLASQGEQLTKQGEQLTKHGEQLAKQGEEIGGLKAAVLRQGDEMAGLKSAVLQLVAHVEKMDDRQRKQGEDIARIDGRLIGLEGQVRRACRNFRVGALTMGPKEALHGTTQATKHPRSPAGPTPGRG